MTQTNVSTKAAIAAKHWEGQDVTELLSKSAAVLPAISATEAGTQGRSIAFTATEHKSPINLGAAFRTRTRCRLRGCRRHQPRV